MSIAINEEVLSEIFGVPTEGTRSLRNEKGSKKFWEIYSKLDDMHIKNLTKKALKR